MKTRPALKKMRFVACVRGVRLLQVSAQAARNAPVGGTVFDFTRRIWIQQLKKFNTQWNLPRENFAAK
jgi:hypothetical protein